MKILIIKFKHIGDVLLSVPVLNALKSHYPDAQIDYLVFEDTKDVVEFHTHVRHVFTVGRNEDNFSVLKTYLKIRKNKYDLTVDLSGGIDRGAIATLIIRGAKRIGAMPVNKHKSLRLKMLVYTHLSEAPNVLAHSVMRDISILNPLGIHIDSPLMDMHIPNDVIDKAKNLLVQFDISDNKKYILIHPTSRWLFKCIGDQAMAELVDRIPKEIGYKVILTCGPSKHELQRLQEITRNIESAPVIFPGNLELMSLAGLIKYAELFIGVDSAPAHISAALGVPTIAIFGPTGAYNWGPWPNQRDSTSPYPNQAGGIQRAGKHVVYQQQRHCMPCGKAGCDFSGISDCLTSITADEILVQIQQMIEH